MRASRSASNSYSRRSGSRVHQGVSATLRVAVSVVLADLAVPAAVGAADGMDGADARVDRPSDSWCLPPFVVLCVSSRTVMVFSGALRPPRGFLLETAPVVGVRDSMQQNVFYVQLD